MAGILPGMDRDGFWDLIERSARESSDPFDRTEWLEARLRELPLDDVVDFHAHLDEVESRAMSWMMWSAAFRIRRGCSDDGFETFRMWLVGLGCATFDQVVREPDRLAELPEVRRLADRHPRDWSEAEWPGWEELAFVAVHEYERRLGECADIYEAAAGRITDTMPTLVDERWDDDDPEEFARRLPQLAALFVDPWQAARLGSPLLSYGGCP